MLKKKHTGLGFDNNCEKMCSIYENYESICGSA